MEVSHGLVKRLKAIQRRIYLFSSSLLLIGNKVKQLYYLEKAFTTPNKGDVLKGEKVNE
jgi:hypothetical protein